MHQLQDWPEFQKVYRPLQPTAHQKAGIGYAEYAPTQALKDIVYCYWELTDHRKESPPFSYKVLADGCTDLYYNVRDAADAQVMGFFHRFQSFPLDPGFHYAGIRFFPGCFHSIFYREGFEDPSVEHPVANLFPDLAKLLFEIDASPEGALHRWEKLQQWLSFQLQKTSPADHRVINAIYAILENKGQGDLKEPLNTGLSPRHMRRLFQQYVGSTPKLLARVVRFQSVLRMLHDERNTEVRDVFLDAGFYDQAHFSKDFKAFYGVSPASVFQQLLQ